MPVTVWVSETTGAESVANPADPFATTAPLVLDEPNHHDVAPPEPGSPLGAFADANLGQHGPRRVGPPVDPVTT